MKDINKLLGINDARKAPTKLMEVLYYREKRESMLINFLEAFNFDVTYDWFHKYFQDFHADRRYMKQDFTPKCISDVLVEISGTGEGERYDCAAGTGGLTIHKWQSDRVKSSFFKYKPSNYLYVCEELSSRAIPFLLFNTLIRGMNAIIIHCDVLSRNAYGAFFVQNDTNDMNHFSSLNVMPYSQDVANFLTVKFVSEGYSSLIESKTIPPFLL